MKTIRMKKASVALAVAAVLFGYAQTQAQAQTKANATIRFSWKLKGEFAPLYVALDTITCTSHTGWMILCAGFGRPPKGCHSTGTKRPSS